MNLTMAVKVVARLLLCALIFRHHNMGSRREDIQHDSDTLLEAFLKLLLVVRCNCELWWLRRWQTEFSDISATSTMIFSAGPVRTAESDDNLMLLPDPRKSFQSRRLRLKSTLDVKSCIQLQLCWAKGKISGFSLLWSETSWWTLVTLWSFRQHPKQWW